MLHVKTVFIAILKITDAIADTIFNGNYQDRTTGFVLTEKGGEVGMDIEKVIKGLEMCTKPAPSYCRQCPYRNIPDDYPHCVHDRLQQDALALLKEQHELMFGMITNSNAKCTELGIHFRRLVLCKDCKHRPIKPNDYENGFDLKFPDSKCPCQCSGDNWYSWYPNDDFFCAYGERR